MVMFIVAGGRCGVPLFNLEVNKMFHISFSSSGYKNFWEVINSTCNLQR